MLKTILLTFATILVIFVSFCSSGHVESSIPSLPYCPSKNGSGFILVSTLDGKLSAVNSSGQLAWQIDTGPGPLLASNIHQNELQNNAERIRIIPSLSGMLYKFNGDSIDAIPISAEMLLKASFHYSDDLVIAGGIEVRKYGIALHTGKLLYECTPVQCLNGVQTDVDDVLLLERTTQTVRAVEPQTGHERWNFSVGLHNISIPNASCKGGGGDAFDWNITAVLPDGLLKASAVKENGEHSWTYTFATPIVRVWSWSGSSLTEINLFAPRNIPNVVTAIPYLPSIYVGMYRKQLYIQESILMQHALQGKSNNGLEIIEKKGVPKIPWKPIAASSGMEGYVDDSTAMSVLQNSEKVNGNGYYLYSEENTKRHEPLLCENNHTIRDTEEIHLDEDILEEINDYNWVYFYANRYWQVCFVLFLIYVINFAFRWWGHGGNETDQEIIIIEKPVEAQITTMEKRNSERDDSNSESFSSRYVNDFDTIRCLGRGGFGVVFEVKQKIDECHYAIKRIPLPNDPISRDRVMREVKALAKLDHRNIVRYFCSWVERPPVGWEDEHDRIWNDFGSMSDGMSASESTQPKQRKSKKESVCIDIPLEDHDSSTASDDSFIVFEKNRSTDRNSEVASLSGSSRHVSLAEDTLKTLRDDFTVELSISGYGTRTESKESGKRRSRWELRGGDTQKPAPVYLYIQMQLCQKQSLKDWLSLNSDREYQCVLDIFLQILHAVEYVHLRGLIHRDLKPSNIFFSLDCKVKVGDFGLVKDMEGALEGGSCRKSRHSAQGHTLEVGTRLYMSPEQFQTNQYDCKVDIYALGLIFFELLVPFSTDMERIKTLTDVKKQVYPAEFQNKFPHEYNLLQNMLCADPNKRLTATGLKSRPPFNMKGPSANEDYQYNLNALPKIQ